MIREAAPPLLLQGGSGCLGVGAGFTNQETTLPPKASSQQQELSRTGFHPNFAYDPQETRQCIFRRLQNAFLQAPKDTHCSQNKFEITQIRILLPESKWQNAFLGACISAGALDNSLPKASSGQYEPSRCQFHPNNARDLQETGHTFFGACKMHLCRHLGQRAAQSFLATAGTIANSLPSKFCLGPSGNTTMHFSAPAKCISADAQRYTLLPKQMRLPGLAKCTSPPCQREFSVQTMPQCGCGPSFT